MDKTTLTKEINELHADICSALADPNRILILYHLADKALKVSELAHEIAISQPATSRHLKILRDRGLVIPARQGVSVTYRLADHRLIDALDILRTILRDRISHRADLMKSDRI